jgi:hypothetical protein
MKPKRISWGDPGCKVRRVVESFVFSKRRRAVVVTIYLDCVGYRLKGERKEYFRDPSGDYRDAVMQTKRAERARRKAERKR